MHPVELKEIHRMQTSANIPLTLKKGMGCVSILLT